MSLAAGPAWNAAGEAVPRRRWRIAWLLSLGVLVNYLDRVNLSVSHDALVTTFGISTVTFGYLTGAYSWTYAACQLPVGVILDRFGIRRVGCVSTFLWSVASFAAAVAPTLGGFFAARLLLGVGEASTFPGSAKAVGYWFPRAERSSATSVFDCAAKFASAIGVPLIGIMLLKIGWRWSFAVTGLISLLYFAIFWRVYRDPKDDPGLTVVEWTHISEAADVPRTDNSPQASLGFLMRQRKVLGMALGFGAYNYVFYLLLGWLPTYLSSELHIDLLHSFLYTGVPWLLATAAELLVAGWLMDSLIRRGWDESVVRQAVLVGGTALGLGILGAANTHSVGWALAWISISISGLAAASAVGWSVPSLIVARGSVGRVGAILNFSNQINAIAAPIVTGYVVAWRHSFTWAFGLCAGYLVISISGYLFLLGRIEPMQLEPPLAS